MSLATPAPLFLEQLKSIVGSSGWVLPAEAQKYFVDLRGQFTGNAALIVRPSTTSQVSRILASCNDAGIGVVPYGAGTGGSAGHIYTDRTGAVVISLERMTAIRSINIEDNALVAEAGCVLAVVQSTARKHNRRFGLSLASESSCTIGGNLACNAGGIQVIKYGNARDLCLGIEAVLPDGSILHDTNTLRKNNTGYDLRHLLIGSEGTLGIITAASLKLSPCPEQTTTLMCAIASPAAAVSLLHTLFEQLGEVISAFELMSDLGVALAVKHFTHLHEPFDQHHRWYVLMEIEGYGDVRSRLEAILAQRLEPDTIIDAAVAESQAQSRNLWDLRELAYEYNRKEGVIYSSDTSVPISRIQRFIEQISAALLNLDASLRINCYGHIGDGNIHVNIFPPENITKTAYLEANVKTKKQIHTIINDVTYQCHGAISAEHGIGRLKIAEMNQFADPTKLAVMAAIKNTVDPNGIMNPGALFGK